MEVEIGEPPLVPSVVAVAEPRSTPPSGVSPVSRAIPGLAPDPVTAMHPEGGHSLRLRLLGTGAPASDIAVRISPDSGAGTMIQRGRQLHLDFADLSSGVHRIMVESRFWSSPEQVIEIRDTPTASTLVVTPINRTVGLVMSPTGPARCRVEFTLRSRSRTDGVPLYFPPMRIDLDLEQDGAFDIGGWPVSQDVSEVRLTARVASLGSASTAWIPVASSPAFHLLGIELLLEPDTIVTGAIRSAVDLKPVAGAQVVLRPATDELLLAWISERGEVEETQVSDERGSFVFTGPSPIPVRVTVTAAGFAPWRSDVLDPSVSSRHVVDVMLSPAGRIEGQVIVDADPPLLPHQVQFVAAVDGRVPDDAPMADLDADGRFVLEDLPVGEARLDLLSALGSGDFVTIHQQAVVVLAGQTTSVRIQLGVQSGVVVHGQVLATVPYPLFALLLDGATGQPHGPPAPVTADGRFEVHALTPSSAICMVVGHDSAGSMVVAVTPVFVPDEGSPPTVFLDPGRTSLHLEDLPAKGMEWRLQARTGEPDLDRALSAALSSMPSAGLPRLQIDGLAPGRYSITLGPEGAIRSVPVELRHGATEVISLAPIR